MSGANDLLDKALQLPAEERASLAWELLRSLEPDPPSADYQAAWSAEINARLDRVAAGDYAATDWREAVARIRQSLPRRSGS